MSTAVQKTERSLDFMKRGINYNPNEQSDTLFGLLNDWTEREEKSFYINPPRTGRIRKIDTPFDIFDIEPDIVTTDTPSSNQKEKYTSLFRDIQDEIELSKEILKLKDGWDGFDSPAIPKEIYNTAIRMLKEYSESIFKSTGKVIQTPEINPSRNRDIHLSWRTQHARLLIDVEKDINTGQINASFYGDHNNKRFPFKGVVTTDYVVEYLASWMKILV